MKKNGKIIFIADAHLVDAADSSDGFFEFLKKIGESEYQIVFLGDIFELWIAFDAYEEPIHRRFLEWCRTEKERRMVGFLEGNHEFYVAWRHGDAFTWAAESTHWLSDGKICLMHGDRVNESDFLYRVFRAFMRNPVTRLVVRLAGPGIGRALSQKILYGLKNKNMRYKKNFPERYFCRLADEMEKKNMSLCLMGHFHQALSLRGINVLPAWNFEDGEVGVYDSDSDRYYLTPWRNLFPETKGE